MTHYGTTDDGLCRRLPELQSELADSRVLVERLTEGVSEPGELAVEPTDTLSAAQSDPGSLTSPAVVTEPGEQQAGSGDE